MSDQFQEHLARGGELLKADKVEEARAALESARALRPSDTKTLSLLGLVYFRTSDFARARGIFIDLVQRQPADPALRLNLGLVHLKLGEGDDAITHLAEAVKLEPGTSRATGYLGLAYARAGRFAEARQAFLAAGQDELAREMEGHLEAQKEQELEPDVIEVHREESAGFAAPTTKIDKGPFDQQAPASGLRPPPAEPSGSPTKIDVLPAPVMPAGSASGKDTLRTRANRPSTIPFALERPRQRSIDAAPTPILEALARNLVAADDAGASALELGPGGVLVVRPRPRCLLRGRLAVAQVGKLSQSAAPRREKGRAVERPFGSEGDEDRMLQVSGGGAVVLAPPSGSRFTLFALEDDGLYVREELLVAFTESLQWENGRVPQSGDTVPLVQLRGKGALALATRGMPLAIKLTADAPLSVPAARLIGWLGRVVPCLRDSGDGPARIECTGEGAVLVDGAELPAA